MCILYHCMSFFIILYVLLLLCILIVMYFYYYVTCYFVSLIIFIVIYVPFRVFCLIVLLCVLFVCKCVLDCCHRDIGALFDYSNWGLFVLFLSCKTNARVQLAKTGHGPYFPAFFYCYVCSVLWILCTVFVCKCVLYYCHLVSTQMQLKNKYIKYIKILMFTKRSIHVFPIARYNNSTTWFKTMRSSAFSSFGDYWFWSKADYYL
jgi:hypothetical protein